MIMRIGGSHCRGLWGLTFRRSDGRLAWSNMVDGPRPRPTMGGQADEVSMQARYLFMLLRLFRLALRGLPRLGRSGGGAGRPLPRQGRRPQAGRRR